MGLEFCYQYAKIELGIYSSISGKGEIFLTFLKMENLHQQFVQLGREKLRIDHKLQAMLPEIYARGIYKKYAESIFEYAGRFASMPKSTVEKALRLEKNLLGKPELREAISVVGVHKVAIVAKLATPETDKTWSQNVKTMSKNALCEFAKEIRHKGEGPCEAAPRKKRVVLEGEVLFLFEKTKHKFPNLSDSEVLGKLLRGDAAKRSHPCASSSKSCLETRIGRYISAARKREAIGDGKCAYPNCQKPFKHLHHQRPYSISKSHDSVVPLCKTHHELAHCGVITKNWQVRVRAELSPVDLLYQSYRN